MPSMDDNDQVHRQGVVDKQALSSTISKRLICVSCSSRSSLLPLKDGNMSLEEMLRWQALNVESMTQFRYDNSNHVRDATSLNGLGS